MPKWSRLAELGICQEGTCCQEAVALMAGSPVHFNIRGLKMSVRRRFGFTLVEVLIVVVIMAILAATVIPQFTNASTDAKASTSQFNLNQIRAQLQIYKAQHNGSFPDALSKLTSSTNASGTVGTAGASFPFGPYLTSIPVDPFSNSAAVAASTDSPITVTGTTGGYVYNATTGEIRINAVTDPDGAGALTAMNTW